MLRHFRLIALFVLVISNLADKCYSQNNTIDSLKLVLKNATHDTARAKILLVWGELIYLQQPDCALVIWSKAKTLSEINKNKYPKTSIENKTINGCLVQSICNIGVIYQSWGNINKALECFEKSLKIYEEMGDKIGMGVTINNIGLIHNNQGDIPKALECYSRSLKIFEEIGDKQGIADCLYTIGVIYSDKGDIQKALENSQKSLKLREEMGDKRNMAYSHSTIGIIYQNLGNIPKALEHFDKSLKLREMVGDKSGIAQSLHVIGNIYHSQDDIQKSLEYFNRSLKIREEMGYKKGIVLSLNSIGTIYSNQSNFSKALEYYSRSLKLGEEIGDKYGIASVLNLIGSLFNKQSDLSKALENFARSLKINEEIGNKQGVATSLNNIGSIYLKQKSYSKAIEYFLKSIEISKKLGFPVAIREAAKQLNVSYKATGNHKLALENYELYIKMRDSLNNIETQKATIKQQTKYEYDKQKAIEDEKHLAEIKQQEEKAAAEKKRQNIVIASVSIVLLLVAVFSVILFNRFRVTQKQKAVIELKEKETQLQKHIIEEKHKEITDSINYAERIQRSFLATQSHLDSNLNHSSITVTSSSDEGAYREVSNDSSSRYSSPNVELTRTDSNYFVMFKPKDVVSGDFYWSATLSSPQGGGEGGGLFALCTADSTGHGVPGAIMSLLNITSLEKAIETETSPDKILNATRKIIIERLKKDGSEQGGKDGMDCSLCVFDFKNKKLFIANANNPVWIVRNVTSSSEAYREGAQTNSSRYDAQGARASTRTDMEVIEVKADLSPVTENVIEVKGDKMPVGKHDKQDVPFTVKEYDLQKGDIIYTLTDGFPDQFGGEKGKKFMSKNLRELLASNSHLPLNEQKEILEKTFKDWVGDLEQVDDVTVIGIRI